MGNIDLRPLNDVNNEELENQLWSKTKKYTGEWKNNKYNGYGVLLFGTGLKYEGQFVDGKRHGFGTLHWPDGRIYKGEWENGK